MTTGALLKNINHNSDEREKETEKGADISQEEKLDKGDFAGKDSLTLIPLPS